MPLFIAAYPALAAGAKAIGARVAAGAAARGVQQAARYAMSPAGKQAIKEGIKNVLGPKNIAKAKRGVKKACQAASAFIKRYEDEIEMLKDFLEELADNWEETVELMETLGKTSMASLRRSYHQTRKMPGLKSSYPLYYTPSSSSSTNNARPNRVKKRRTG